MERDEQSIYREKLEDLEPDFQDRVNTPWQENIPDVPSFNGKAYKTIERQVKRISKTIKNGEHASSRGILILGEPGTGKTHLLMRVARNLGSSNHIMFVRKPNNESAVATHIWVNMLQSLVLKIPGSANDSSQLDKMLACVFSTVIIPFLEDDIAAGKDVEKKQKWVGKLRENPENLFAMLGKGEIRNQNIQFIRRRTLSYLSEHEPGVDQKTARALITYYFMTRINDKQAVLAWLQGQQIESGTAVLLGINSTWIEIEEDSDSSVRQQNEEQALRSIKTIGLLAKYYQPLILAFDQLEGLNQQEQMTLIWGDMVREIFTVTPNFIIVTCLFPSLWESWFVNKLDQSVRERVAQYPIELENFSIEHAKDILNVRMKNVYETLDLPNEIYPFIPYDIDSLCKNVRSPRSFLNNASHRFDQWLDEDEEVMNSDSDAVEEQGTFPPLENEDDQNEEKMTKEVERKVSESIVVKDKVAENILEKENSKKLHKDYIVQTIKNMLDKQQRLYTRSSLQSYIDNEEEFFGVLRDFTLQLLDCCGHEYEHQRGSYQNLVMPPTTIIKAAGCSRNLVISICNSKNHSLSFRIKNLSSCVGKLKNPLVLFLRNWGAKIAKDSVASYYLEKLNKVGHYIRITKKESSFLMALYDTLVAIEQQDLVVDNIPITKKQFFEVLIEHKIINQSQLFHILIDQEKWPKKYNVTAKVSHKKEEKDQQLTDVEKREEDHCSLSTSEYAHFFNNLELPNSDLQDLQNAAQAVKDEFEYHGTFKTVTATKAKVVEEKDGTKLYRITLSSPLYLNWKIEGSNVFCFRENSTEDYEWSGYIVECIPDTGEVFLVTSHEIAIPSYFHIKPFEFMSNLYSLYNEEDYEELATKYLPKLLAACKGNLHPLIRSKSHYHGLPKLSNLWQYSWEIIWGPPGTGKTYTIGQQVASCIHDSEERFLIVSTTNKATDEVVLSVAKAIIEKSFASQLDKVIRVGRGVNFQKFGSEFSDIVDSSSEVIHAQIASTQNKLAKCNSSEEKAKLRSHVKELRGDLIDRSLQVFQNKKYQVVVTTAFNAISLLTKESICDLLQRGKTPFTTVIIDEAGIISKAATAALAMFASNRVILTGDPKQLSPITKIKRILPSEQSQWLGESSLNHLENDQEEHAAVYILEEQYRMHPGICSVVSAYQYAGLLRDSSYVTERDNFETCSDLPRASWYVLDEETKDPTEIRARRSDKNTSWLRPYTAKILDKIFAAFPDFTKMNGLFIAPFAAQITEIKNYFLDSDISSWQAATVHSQQGAEEDIVIIDTVYANSNAWSYAEWQRLMNVAISRAKQWVIVISSREEMQQPFLNPLVKLLSPFTIPKGKKTFSWDIVQARVKHVIPQEIRENPHLLGNQLRSRKSLRPILSFEQERLCQLKIDGKPRLVRGVAGSGKTIVLAHWLAKSLAENPRKTMCVVYANKSLKSLINQFTRKAWEKIMPQKTFPERHLKVYHIRDLLRDLHSQLRIRIQYKGKEHYDYDLQAEACLEQQQCLFPICYSLFIDEAQDLGPTALKLLFQLTEENHDTGQRSVMIFYDNAQNLYDRKVPKWSDFGLELRGRSTIMKESFRSTNPICQFALNVLYKLQPQEINSDHNELVKLGLLERMQEPKETWQSPLQQSRWSQTQIFRI